MYWYLRVLKQYATFSGRAQRKEYWMFTLFNFIVYVVVDILQTVASNSQLASVAFILAILYLLYSLGILIPSVAVTARRLHDIGKSGWWMLISIIPLIGAIILLVLLITDSKPGDNQYGPNPKGVGGGAPAPQAAAPMPPQAPPAPEAPAAPSAPGPEDTSSGSPTI